MLGIDLGYRVQEKKKEWVGLTEGVSFTYFHYDWAVTSPFPLGDWELTLTALKK